MWHCAGVPFSDTYISYDARGRSCIDHFVVSNSLVSHVNNVEVYECSLNASNHSPLLCDIDCTANVSPACLNESAHQLSIAWGRINDNHIVSYQMSVNDRLNAIQLPICFTECLGVCCSSAVHKREIDEYCAQFCICCIECGRSSFPLNRPNKFSRPKWKELMKPLKDEALFLGFTLERLWKAS